MTAQQLTNEDLESFLLLRPEACCNGADHAYCGAARDLKRAAAELLERRRTPDETKSLYEGIRRRTDYDKDKTEAALREIAETAARALGLELRDPWEE